MSGQGVLDARRRRRRARLPARLEPLADRRVAGQARRDPRGHRPAGLGDRGRRLHASAPRRCRSSACSAPPSCCVGRAPRIHWYSLYDLPQRLAGDDAPPRGRGLVLLPPLLHGPAARGRHAQARAARASPSYTPELGICQWFHFEDHRLDDAVRWLKRLGVTHLRTGLQLGRQLPARRRRLVRPADGGARADFDVTVTFCFTPEHRGHRAAPHQPAAGARGVRRVLRAHDPPLRAGGVRAAPPAPPAGLHADAPGP